MLAGIGVDLGPVHTDGAHLQLRQLLRQQRHPQKTLSRKHQRRGGGLIQSGILRRVVAQSEITFPNSLTEAWWRTREHQCPFLNTLDSRANVTRLVAFFVEAHYREIPHAAFHGQTPGEMYYGRDEGTPKQLECANGKR